MITKQELSEILARVDVERLIKLGAPSDEYDYEAAMVLERITPNSTLSEIAQVCYDVFGESFHVGHQYPNNDLESEPVTIDMRPQRKDTVAHYMVCADLIHAKIKGN